jgi:predicted AAA+ superfamily ATPase
LSEQALTPSTYGFGETFEHFLILEIFRLLIYREKSWSISYFRSASDLEVDLVIERPGAPSALVEIKLSKNVGEKYINSLVRLKKDFQNAEAAILCLEPSPRRVNDIEILPWQEGIKWLGL